LRGAAWIDDRGEPVHGTVRKQENQGQKRSFAKKRKGRGTQNSLYGLTYRPAASLLNLTLTSLRRWIQLPVAVKGAEPCFLAA
jgi:hypothetical protein